MKIIEGVAAIHRQQNLYKILNASKADERS